MTDSQATTASSAESKQLNIAIDASLKQQLKLHAVKSQLPLNKFAERLLRQGISQLNGTDGQDVVRSGNSVPVESAG
jgi:hypothetical protein